VGQTPPSVLHVIVRLRRTSSGRPSFFPEGGIVSALLPGYGMALVFKISNYSIFGAAGMAEQRVPGSFAGT